jgi:hypothetical protein
LFLSFPLVITTGPTPAEPPTFDPVDCYEVRQVEGWQVLVHKPLLANQPSLAHEALTLLGVQLYQVKRNVPSTAVVKLQSVRFWVEDREPPPPCMTYHPDPDWLRGHGFNPEKARCIEIANPRNFLKWSHKQPWMVLHELAHAYHHQFLEQGFENPSIAKAYRKAVEAKSYDAVLDCDGQEVRAYALTNPMEYFAEATEAYFGSNDYYPFVRAELRKHDPAAHDLLETLWGVR